MKILVTGATGFTGGHVIRLLQETNHETTCLVRRVSKKRANSLTGVRLFFGDVDDPDSLREALRGKVALINIVPLVGPNETPNMTSTAQRAKGLVQACKAAGVNRAIFVSSTSIFTTIDAASKSTKIRAEEEILKSDLDYTILRPTMIYGGPEDRNMIRLIRFLRRYPVVPVPGNGKSRQQPIHVGDLAHAILNCLMSDGRTIGKAYNLSGAEPTTFDEVIRLTCASLGVRRMVVHIPLKPALWAGQIFPRMRKRSWIKEERLLRINEDRCFDHSEASRDFNFSPRPFAEGINEEVLCELGPVPRQTT